jgi:protoporphyrinogen oxidase
LLAGCSWLAAKWKPLAGHQVTLIRCLIGENGDAGASVLDEVLARRVHDELAEAMELAAPPLCTTVCAAFTRFAMLVVLNEALLTA